MVLWLFFLIDERHNTVYCVGCRGRTQTQKSWSCTSLSLSRLRIVIQAHKVIVFIIGHSINKQGSKPEHTIRKTQGQGSDTQRLKSILNYNYAYILMPLKSPSFTVRTQYVYQLLSVKKDHWRVLHCKPFFSITLVLNSLAWFRPIIRSSYVRIPGEVVASLSRSPRESCLPERSQRGGMGCT